MAQEEKVDEQLSEEQESKDNQDQEFDLHDELVEFNSPEEQEDQKEDEGSKETVVAEKAESKGVQNKEEDKIETKTDEESSDKWLIDGKFRNDDEGREKLAKSYKEMQSMYDKSRQSAEEGQKLTEFLRANPEAVEAMQNVVEKKQSDSSPPEMPEDFDSLDIYAEGTTSNDWYKEQREYERKQIIGEVVNAVQGELGARDNKQHEAQEESEYLDYLKNDEKLNDDQIKEYLEFMTNDENVTTKNMVKVWRILSGQQMENGISDNLPPSRADEKRQVPSAAAISGSAPPKPTAQKVQDQWIDGLMEFSKKY